MARKTLQDQLRASAKSATALGAQHRAIIESLRPVDHPENKFDQEVRPEGPTQKSDLKVGPKSRTQKSYLQVQVRPESPTFRSDCIDLKVRPEGPTSESYLQVPPGSPEENEPNLVKAKEKTLTQKQQRVFDYLLRQGPHVTDKSIVAEATGLSPFTVKTILVRLASLGMLDRSRVGQGMRLVAKLPGAGVRQGPTAKSDYQVRLPSPTVKSDLHLPLKIDRKNLSISLENMSLTWPRLAATGFGPDQLAQIEANLTETGQSTERVLPSLHHAEWELENGKMLDKDGKPVADPCSWVFRSLARTGYYRRPAGYVSPEEQAARDAEAEARAVSCARQSAEQAQFEAWRDSLSPDKLKSALQGHPGGSRDAWLKRVWREKQGKRE